MNNCNKKLYRVMASLAGVSLVACNATDIDFNNQVSDTNNISSATNSTLPDITEGLPDLLTTGGPGGETNASEGVDSTSGGGEDTSGDGSTGGKGDSSSSSDGGNSTTGGGDSTTTSGEASTGDTTGKEDTTGGDTDGELITDPPGEMYAVSLTLNRGSTFALLNTGDIKAWGHNPKGVLGYGNVDAVTDPSKVGFIDIGFKAKQVVAGAEFACVLAADDEPEAGKVRCFGYDSAGNLGRGKVDLNNPNIGDDEMPSVAPLITLQSPIVELAAGWQHVCARMKNGKVSCWGKGSHGQLGYGDKQNVGDDELPGAKGDVDVGWPVVAVAAGGNMTCAMNQEGEARCWGAGVALGNGVNANIGDNELPSSQPAVNFGFAIKQLAIGTEHMCALSTAKFGSQVKCVGTGLHGRLGYGDLNSRLDASKVEAVALPIVPIWIDAMEASTCVNSADGETACFGYGGDGNLGYASTDSIGDDDIPSDWGTVTTGIDVVQVYAGALHTCALSSSAEVQCWGLYPIYPFTIGANEVPAAKGVVKYL